MGLSRRRLLALGAAASVAGGWRLPLASVAAAGAPDVAALPVPAWLRGGVQRDAAGQVTSVFGLDPATAAEVLLPATRQDALPDNYAPADLVSTARSGIAASGSQLLRALIVDDTRRLIGDAAAAGVELYVGSGFRSQAYQVEVFAAQVQRWGDPETASRYSAMPGHSQHQLGTTIDFTDTFRAFRSSPAADWLRDNAHLYGFVLPYTVAATPRTGYIDEPWHARWVGAPLAAQFQAAGYQAWTDADADDLLAALRSEAGLA